METPTSDITLVDAKQMQTVLEGILLKNAVPANKAKICSEVFTASSVDGVYSHGINRFSKFVSLIRKRIVDVDADPICIGSSGAIEQWNGKGGIGITNALQCTERSMELASKFGLGCVALANTNHWMRAGTYARYAAKNGFVFIGWSNTVGNTPAWGAVDPRLGNNPLAIGVPHNDEAVVLDMAMSQFSYGALDNYQKKGQSLPVFGGFDEDGNLSKDPSAILKTRRTLPIGYWKGSGLSLLLDILATILSGGLSVSEISKQPEETKLSQIFITFHLKSLKNFSSIQGLLDQIITDFKQSAPEKEGKEIRYPGEGVLRTRGINTVNGIPVLKSVWEEVLTLA